MEYLCCEYRWNQQYIDNDMTFKVESRKKSKTEVVCDIPLYNKKIRYSLKYVDVRIIKRVDVQSCYTIIQIIYKNWCLHIKVNERVPLGIKKK